MNNGYMYVKDGMGGVGGQHKEGEGKSNNESERTERDMMGTRNWKGYCHAAFQEECIVSMGDVSEKTEGRKGFSLLSSSTVNKLLYCRRTGLHTFSLNSTVILH